MSVQLMPIGEGPAIPLDKPIVFIGRHADCDVRIDSKKISRRHCAIVQLQDRLVIRDLGSTNGIYWNGQRVEEAVLALKDEIQIANLRYQVQPSDAPPSELPVAAVVQVAAANDLEQLPGANAVGPGERKPTQEIPNE